MDIPLPGESIPFPSSSPPLISKSPPPIPPLPPDFDHIPLPPSVGKQSLSPPTVNHLSKAPPLPPTIPPLPPVSCKTFPILPPLPSSPKGVPSVEAKGNGEAILWSSIPPPPAPAPPAEDSRYSPSHATPADEENERILLPPSFSLLPPPPPPADSAPNPPPPASLHSPPKMPPLPPSRPPPPAAVALPRSEPPPPLPAAPPKTAVLGRTQAKKRLLAFSMTKQGGGLGLSFGFAKSARVVNKASANAFVGSGEDEETGEKKEATSKNRKKKKEEREVLAIEEIKREEERLKEALGIRQQAQRAEQWAEEMWGITTPAVGEGMLMTAPTVTAVGTGTAAQVVEERDAASSGEGAAVASVDAAVPGGNQEGNAASSESHRHSERDPAAQGETANVLEETTSNTEHGETVKVKEEPGEGKEERKEGGGGEKREKKGEKSSSSRSKKDKESGERSRRREEEGGGGGGGDKERSKRGKGGSGGGRSERRSDRKRESRRSTVANGPPLGWKQLKDMFGGEWKGEKIPQRTSGSREDRGRDRRSSRGHGSRSRDHKRSGHSSHRSRSGSADVHRRPQPSPFFVAKGAKHGEKEFPLRLLRHTRTRPPLSYCENPETAAPPRPTTRKEAFASEPPEVVRIMRLVAEAGLEKESEGRENSKEASGLAALRVSYEGGDEEEGDDEQKRSDRSWFLTLAAFLSESSSTSASAKVALKRSASPQDLAPVKEKDRKKKRDEEMVPKGEDSADSEGSMKEGPKDDSDEKEEEEEEEEEDDEDEEEEEEEEEKAIVKAEAPSPNEASEPIVHSKWDSDYDSGGVATLEKGKVKATPSPEVKEEQLESSEGEEVEDREKEERMEVEEEEEVEKERRGIEGVEEGEKEEVHPALVDGRSESEASGESEGSREESEEEEEMKDQQLASEYEEFMKAVSVGEEDEDDDAWGLDGERHETTLREASDHRDSDSSGHNSSKHHDAVHDRSSDVEMASDAPSSEDASTGRKAINESSSDSEAIRNPVSKEEMESVDETAITVKEKTAKRKERSKRGNSESAAESDVEVQIPKKKRKTSGKKLTVVGESIKKKTGGDKKKKLKAKEKSDKKKKEKERKRKRKKKDRRKKKGRRRRDDSSEVESESEEDEEEGSDSNEHAGNAKVSRSKVSDGVHKRRSHRGEPSSEEMSSDNSSESSDEGDRRKSKKKKRKKRKKHEKAGYPKEDEEDLSEDEGEDKKGKVHYSRRKRSREVKNKHRRESDNSDGSEEAYDHGAIADDKAKAADDSSMAGKENGMEGGGKRGRKQKLKERGRKKKRKSSPPNPKKHVSSRRRSPSTSDGSPTPGRGNHQRGNSVTKTQGNRSGASEGGPSSIESNSSGGTKKPGDNTVDERKPTDSVHRRDGRVEGSGSQKKRNVIEREEKRILDSNRSKSSKAPPATVGKNSGIPHKEKSLRGVAAAKRNAQESVSKKRVAEARSLNMSSSSSSSSSSPSSQSVSSISSSSTESSSSSSSQSDSQSASSSSSSSSSSSASSSASSLTSSTSSSESSSSISSFANLPGSPNAVSAVPEESESEILSKESSKIISSGSEKDFSRSGTPPESPEPRMPDISFSSLSKDSLKLQDRHFDHFEDSLSKFSGIQNEKFKMQVNVRKDSQLNEPPRMRSDCASVNSANTPGCASELRPLVVLRQDSESEVLINPVDSRGRTCVTFVTNEAIQPKQKDDSTTLISTSKSNVGSRESKSQTVNPEPLTFKLCSEEDPMNGKILGDRGVGVSPSQPSRPSRWDTRPVVSECPVLLPCVTSGPGASGREGGREWRENHHPLTAPVLSVLPVPFPTCRDKPLEEIPLPPMGSVPQPVASPWGPEGPPISNAPIILSSSELPINPVCGLADSTISDSDLIGKCVSGGGQLQTGPESSPNTKKVSLDKPYIADNRPTSSESELSVVEQFPLDSNHFLKTRVNVYQDTNQQSTKDKVVDSVAAVFSVEKHRLTKSAELKSAALSGETECVLSSEAEQPPTDWDDPEAFVGPGLTEIKSHVIQVGNFLQVVPSEQPIISHPFTNPTTPIPAVVPLAAVPSGVAPVPVPPAAPVLPVAAPTTISAAFPAPVSPVKVYQPLQPTPSSSNLSLVMPAVQSLPNPPSAAPVSPSTPMPSSTLPSTPPANTSTLVSVAPLIPGLSTTLAPSLPSPTTSSPLSHIPLLASLAPSSSCAGISQLPLDPATILGTLISHALALDKQQKQQQQQQNLVHSPICSPMIGTENEEVPKEAPRAMTRVERQARRVEKRKKMVRGAPSQQHLEKFPVEDAMSNTDPLTNAMPEDYCIDPEEVAFIQEAITKVPGEEDGFEEQSSQVCRVKEKRKKPRVVCNTVLPPATRGILIPPGIREKPSVPSGGIGHGLNSGTQGQRKSVMFADGVRPGDGTSPSAGEDLPSPPPPVRKMPKEKRLRKKKKIKVKIIRQIRMESTEEDDDEDDDASPPPPPPGSPPPSLLLHHLSTSSPAIHHSGGGCEVAVPNPAAHYPYPSAPTAPPTHAFSQLQLQQPQSASQQQLPPLNPTSAPPMATAGGSSALPPNALPRIPQWAPCN